MLNLCIKKMLLFVFCFRAACHGLAEKCLMECGSMERPVLEIEGKKTSAFQLCDTCHKSLEFEIFLLRKKANSS